LANVAPDEPFGGGSPGSDFDPADLETTGQVMQFRVQPGEVVDPTAPPASLLLPAAEPLGTSTVTRQLSLNEEESATVRVVTDQDGNVVLACDSPGGEAFGPTSPLLGTLGQPLLWSDIITENPVLDSVETWEFHNFTEDAHPIHIHQVKFSVVDRELFGEASAWPAAMSLWPGNPASRTR
jgi:FtsP/CotA-like multicopper oxidase with cupredoxin domain